MNQALLSICIPTFNRASYLKRLLDDLLPAIARHHQLINIFIIDNASTDQTAALCDSYIQAGHALNYVRNESNIGADANAVRAFECVNGIYGWILGDDEYVYGQTVDTIIATLTKQPLALLYLKSEPCTASAIAQKKPRSQALSYYTSNVEFSRKIGIYFTFISAIIFNKQQAMQDDALCANIRYGTFIPQLAWVLPLLKQGKHFASSQACLIAAEPNNTTGYKLFEVFGINLRALVDAFLPDQPRLRKAILSSSMWFLASFFYGNRGNFKQENPKPAFDQAFGELRVYRLIVRPLLTYQNLMSKLCVKTICRFRKNILQQA
ncbi:glycosyltransferase family 2 protein [Chromobacterium subtsugae]|nr:MULTISPECIES: glycosyltransferase family 2 protein [Chromobacterium]WSE91263.1 glycosyltransferase family 2 protein [Chromobacterium subtsugae]WVH59638.1 glycosyltransferase family 2 protein [Chromobacterium subtsugae]